MTGLATFPQTPLPVLVEMLLAGQWTDITDHVYTRDGIKISRGRPNETSAGTLTPQACTMTLNNRDGRFSIRNPTGPYYGSLTKNTQVRVTVGQPPMSAFTNATDTAIALGRGTAAVTAPSSGLVYSVFMHAFLLSSGHTGVWNVLTPLVAGVESDRNTSACISGYASAAAGTFASTATARYAVTGDYTTTTSTWIPGATFVGETAQGFTGNVSLLSPTVTSLTQNLIVTLVWESDPSDLMPLSPTQATSASSTFADYQLIVDTGPSVRPRVKQWIAPATHSGFTYNVAFDGPAATEQHVRVAVVDNAVQWYTRFVGELSDLPCEWDLAGKDVYSSVTAAGILRRLQQGTPPKVSALTRYFSDPRLNPAPIAYWPCEDLDGSTLIASGLRGGQPMRWWGSGVQFAKSAAPGSDALPDVGASVWYGLANAYTWTGQTEIRCSMQIPASGLGSAQTEIISVFLTHPTYGQYRVQVNYTPNALSLNLLDMNGGTNSQPGGTLTPVSGVLIDGCTNGMLQIQLTDNGSTLGYHWGFYNMSPTGSGEYIDGTWTAVGLGTVTAVGVGLSAGQSSAFTLAGLVLGQIVVAPDFATPSTRAWLGNEGDAATARVAQLGGQLGVPVAATIGSVASEPMGAQPVADLSTLLTECETADMGIMHEPRQSLGFRYVSRSYSYYEPSRVLLLNLDYAAGHISAPFKPVDDDQTTVNDVLVTREGGSSVHSAVDGGPLSVMSPPNGVGPYSQQVTVNVADDTQLPDQATWRTHLGTWNEARFPNVTIDLARNPGIISAVASRDIGNAITVRDLPAWCPGPLSSNEVALLVLGYSETLDPFGWSITFNCAPYGPNFIAVLNDTTVGLLDSAGSTLNADIGTTDTSMAVNIAAGDAAWTPTLPVTVELGGEQVTVTAISGTTSPQTFTVTRSANGVVKSHVAGEPVNLALPVAVAM